MVPDLGERRRGHQGSCYYRAALGTREARSLREHPTVGRSGVTYSSGKVLTFTGQETIEVRSGSSGATFFTLNGQSLGALGKRGIPETWLFKPGSPPTQTQRQ